MNDQEKDKDDHLQVSETLQQEWRELRKELDSVLSALAKKHSERKALRKAQICERMSEITEEMATVLANAKSDSPKHASKNSEVYSHRRKHVVERTYDSTDSDVSHNTIPDVRTSNARPPAITIEDASTRLKTDRTILTNIGTKIRSTLRKAEPVQTQKRPLDPDERENLKLEESRLEREARRLKRKSDPTEEDERQAIRIAARLQEIADRLLDGTTPNGYDPLSPSVASSPTTDTDAKATRETRLGKGARSFFEASKSPRLWGTKTNAANETEEHASESLDGKSNTPESNGAPKRKPWSGLRALGKTFLERAPVRQTHSEQPREQTSPVRVAPPTDGDDANPYVELANKLHERGDQLKGLDDDAQKMSEGASDMLAAARALRKKKNAKSSFFS